MNTILVIVISIVFLLYIILQNIETIEIENFNINTDLSNDDLKGLIQAIDDIILCENQHDICKGEARIKDFIEFRRSLGYNAFNLSIFLALIEKRLKKKSTLTKDDVFVVVKKFKPQTIADSFKKTGLSLAPDQTIGKFDQSVCKNALNAYVTVSDQRNIEFDAEYRKWKNVTLTNWKKSLQDERNKLYADYLKLPEISRGKFDDYYAKHSKQFNQSPPEPKPPKYQPLQFVCSKCSDLPTSDFPSLRDSAKKCISNIDDEIAKSAQEAAEAAAAAAALQKAKAEKEAADKLKAEQEYEALKARNVSRTKVWAIGLGVGLLLCFIAIIVIVVIVNNKMKNAN